MKKLTFTLLFIMLFQFVSFAGDSLGIKLDEMVFFECGQEAPPKEKRKYIYYSQKSARYIYAEVNMTNLYHNVKDEEYTFTFVWDSPHFLGKERYERSYTITSDEEKPTIINGFNFNWFNGRYTVQVYVNGSLFAEKDFYISDYGNIEYRTFDRTVKSIDVLSKLPNDLSSEILNQYQTKDEFLFYHDIKFSKNGEEFAFKTGNAGKQLLFLNNKQILDYFRLEYLFDNDFSNLAYVGMGIDRGIGHNCTYFKGEPLICHRLVYMFLPYVSPDSKKCCCIADLRTEADFNRDDYLLIGNTEIRPENLKEAKSVLISEPIAFLKNSDNSYNAVYTAKYKTVNNETYYAVFNEAEKISPDYKGSVGVPHISPDEQHMAYVIKKNKEYYITMDDKIVTQAYDKIEDDIYILASDNSIVYKAKIDKEWYVMKNDEKVSVGCEKIKSMAISPDEKSVAYITKVGKLWNVMRDKNKVSGDYVEIGREIVFSPDGSKIAYAAGNKENLFVMSNNTQVSPSFSKKELKYPLTINKDFRYLVFNNKGDKLAYTVTYAIKECNGCDEYDEVRNKNSNYMSYVMINDIEVSPKMYSTALYSPKTGKLVYAGIDIETLILHHVKIEF